ncbi:lipid A disaccharide synthetase [Leptolyngbya sp. PCC 6406]|uniref:lipid A disaccharide synthetase n=1 Tax=Leptolyngbya sp. PCC 6406 TaxID=1173264 RepID=UPI0002ABB4A1|nr:lipid A disaccharide synthetase [Leptolyngbya sp. PCC 6406]
MSAMDVVILSNGPGEVTTWVKPVVRSLRAYCPDRADLRISVVLSPCPNATGREAEIVRQYPEVDRVQGSAHFWSFLLRGKTVEEWDWRDRGVVLFLGGDQIYPVLVGRRLGYRTVVYAEWFANWHRWIDAFGTMNETLVEKVSPAYRNKFQVVGDLMGDGQADLEDRETAAQQLGLGPETVLIGLLPGSKRAKLTQGVPLLLAAAAYVCDRNPNIRFVIPVAPTVQLESLVTYADPQQNPMVPLFDGPQVTLVQPETPDQLPYLKTDQGMQVFLWQSFPAHGVTSHCALCLTTVGANTAELGSLGVPMIVLLPTQQLDAMNAWDGILGLLVNLPLVGKPVNRLVNLAFFAYIRRSGKLFAWPNIWAGREVVPELFGRLTAEQVGDRVLQYLDQPETLAAVRQDLRQVRGESGAAEKLARLVLAMD